MDISFIWIIQVDSSAVNKVVPIGDQVHLATMNKPRPFKQFPGEEHHNHDRDFNIVGNKVDALKVWTEAFPALHEDENAIEADGDDRPDRVCPVLVREEMFEALVANSRSETERCYSNADP